jgi:type III secretion protein J
MSTPLEERARYVHALEREIESTVLDIDGVVAARARVVPQQRFAPGAPLMSPSASLLIKHRRDVDLSALVPGIVQLVKNGVPGLAAEDDSRVAVVLVPEQQTVVAAQAASKSASPAGSLGWRTAWRSVVAPTMLALAGGVAGYGLSRWRERRRVGQAQTARDRDE